ncbi:MAG: type II toxin-antitoxin system HicA family toxin [Nitrospina sp.]|jgi:predicted RNA binding protein YcfA (HicA-like mRNA interferase family)|nr:type II toxin-antitoxin system HicA family toxin [Nitrospina sp.]
MTKKELLKILRKAGWRPEREGKHEIWSKSGKILPIPRHKGDIPIGTVNNIFRRAGIKKTKEEEK